MLLAYYVHVACMFYTCCVQGKEKAFKINAKIKDVGLNEDMISVGHA